LGPLGIGSPNSHDEYGKAYYKNKNEEKISWGIAPRKPW
jgi:hypothetical protein